MVVFISSIFTVEAGDSNQQGTTLRFQGQLDVAATLLVHTSSGLALVVGTKHVICTLLISQYYLKNCLKAFYGLKVEPRFYFLIFYLYEVLKTRET